MSTLLTGKISAPIPVGHAVTAALGQKRNRRVVVSASVGVFQRLVQLGGTLVVMPLLLRVLGPAQFGIWGAAASLAWLSGLVDIGTGSALVTLVARSSASDRTEQARRHIAGALSIGTGLAGVIIFIAFVASVFGVSGELARGNAEAYLIAAIGLAVNLPLNAGNNVWMALQKGYVSGCWELVQTLLTTSGLVVAATLTKDVRVYVTVVYAAVILANVGSLVHLFLRHSELRPHGQWLSLPAMREVAGQGSLYFVLALMGGLSFLLDNVFALGLLGPEASAQMTIALRICVTAIGGLAVLSQPLWPAFADAAEKGDRRWILKALLRGSAVLVGLTLVGSTLLLMFGERLLHWWLHTDLGIGKGLLWAISAWALAQALIRIPILLLNALSVLHYQIAVVSVTTGLAIAVKFALARDFGVAGILWGTSATTLLILTPACLWRIWRWTTCPVARPGELP